MNDSARISCAHSRQLAMRRVWTICLVSFAAVTAVIAAFRHTASEPVYAGKKLTRWLDSGSEPAAMAVHAIGPAATPWIFHKLRWEHPRWGRWVTYQIWWQSVPTFARSALPKPRVAAYDEFKASMALLEVGPQVVPQLIEGLKEHNPGVRLACALAAQAIQARALKDQKLLAALRAAARDGHPEVRQEIAKLIAEAEPQRSP